MIPAIWHSGKNKTMGAVKRSMVARVLVGGEKWVGRGLLGCKTILYGTLRAGTCHWTFVKPIECITPRMNPNVNPGLWSIMCVNVGSSMATNALSRCGFWWRRQGYVGDSLYLQLNFTVNYSKKYSLLIKILKVTGKPMGDKSDSRT